MKLLLTLLLSFFLFVPNVSAHGDSNESFIQVNHISAKEYPVSITSLSDIKLPNYFATKPSLVNEPITLELNPNILQIQEELRSLITFTWDFGDGSEADGTTVTHTYTKPGSYLITVVPAVPESQDTQVLLPQSILLHVLPNESYQLPQAKISLNGKVYSSKDNSITLSSSEIVFDASPTLSGSSPIATYTWDLGNGQGRKEKSFSYAYLSSDPTYLFPVLRVTDTLGFISDTYIQVERSDPTVNGLQTVPLPIIVSLIVLVNIVIGGVLYFLLKKRRI